MPINMAMYLSFHFLYSLNLGMSFLEGKSLEDNLAELKRKYLPTYVVSRCISSYM